MPYTKIQFLVTQQNFQFDVPIKNCPTIDNILIQIEVSIVMRVRSGEENVRNFCYKTSVNQLNEQLDAAISERVRVLARSKTYLEAYNIKGKEHTDEMVNYLNSLFDSKGVEIRSVIITNVKMDESIADILEEKATYGVALNALEKKKQFYEIRVLNDEQEFSLKQETMTLDRVMEEEKFKLSKCEIEKLQRKILADTQKIVAEVNEKTNAEVKKVDVRVQLDAQEIKNETNMVKTIISAEGAAKAKRVIAEAD